MFGLRLRNTLDCHIAAVTLHKRSSDVESQSRAGPLLPSGHLGRPAPVEDVLQVLGADPGSVVLDADEEVRGVLRNAHLHLTGRELDRVVDEIGYGVLDD